MNRSPINDYRQCTRAFLALAAGVLLLGALGCSSVQQAWDEAHNAPPLRLDTGAINGRLTDAETSRPLPSGRVELLDAEGEPVQDQSARAWVTEGAFEFPNVQPGRYRLRVEADGYDAFLSGPININAGTIARLEYEVTPAG